MGDLKLFVWDDVLNDATSGLIIALAHDVDEARRVVLAGIESYEQRTVRSAIEDEPKVYTEPVARVVFGGG